MVESVEASGNAQNTETTPRQRMDRHLQAVRSFWG